MVEVNDSNRNLELEKKDTGSHALERSAIFLNNLVAQLEASDNFNHLKEIPLDYSLPFSKSLQEFPHQIAAVIGLFQPDIGTTINGFIDSNSSVITTKRSEQNKWAPGTWTVPMGKIESKDASTTDVLGHVILNAGQREVQEEIIRENSGGFSFVTNSFLDESTGNLIHVVVEEIGEIQTEDKVSKVLLPDLREHSDITWTQLNDIPLLSPMNPGSKFVFLTALKFIQEQNTTSLTSNRYK